MTDRRNLYKDFQKHFPKEHLKEMTLAQYTNLERKDSFCYWVEHKTRKLGSILGGSSHKFGIYEYQTKPKDDQSSVVNIDDKYAWYSKYAKKTAEEAFAVVKNAIINIAEYAGEGNWEAIEKMNDFGDVYKWKIAFLYSNESLIPIYRKEMLVELATHFGMSNASKADVPELQMFLFKQKGDKDLYEFTSELLELLKMDEKIKGHHVWMYAPGENAYKWEDCLSQKVMRIGWEEMGNLDDYKTKEDITTKLKKIYDKPNDSFKNISLALWEFSHVMQVGDIIIVKKGKSKIVGRGIVESDYYFDDTYSDYNHVRNVNWTNVGEWDVFEKNALKTLTDITKFTDSVSQIEKLFTGESLKQYWWLVANPKVWSFSETPVGAVQDYSFYNDDGHKRHIFDNFINAKAGDLVIGYETSPTKQIVATAYVDKVDYNENSIYFRKTESLQKPVDLSILKNTPTLNNMEFFKYSVGSLFKLTEDEYHILMSLIRENNPVLSYEKYTVENFLNDVYFDSDEYDKLKKLLETKKNIILQGAPGVGKTFCAKRLAYSMIGEKDKNRIEFIQFHQNYSYEDFVMGYKPKEDGTFKLKGGVFYNFCKKAQSDPDKSYFFIIDEINRGNLSKIFGELLMLIENNYRGERHKIRLAYKDEEFSVPENLYIIGMMNTADRSLAMIDYALRRRFSFYEMKPSFDSKGFKEYQEKLGSEKFNKAIDIIKEINKEIEKDESLKDGYCIGHSYFCNQENFSKEWLSNVIEYDIKPMLREYWFDDDHKYNDACNKLASLNGYE